MAINFPDSPTNGQQTSAGGNTWQYNSTKSVWEKTLTSGKTNLGITVYATVDDLPLSGVSAGAQAFVTGSNRLYISNGTGWYSIGLVNTNPSITSVQDASANTTPFTLSTDGSATVITVTANDPENVPLTYSYAVTAGSLTNGGGTTATVTQADNVFTVTPSTTEAYAGTFSLTFTVSDGINTATSANSFTLQFITIIANSRYTTLLATATDTSDNNNITDSSTNNYSITVNGDAHAGTFSPYRSGGYSTYFDGAGDYLNAPANAAFEFGTGDFSMELFFYRTTSGSVDTLVRYGNASVTGWLQTSWAMYISSSNYLTFEVSDGSSGGAGRLSLVSSVLFPTNSWVHVSVVRDGNNFTLYQNGNSVATTTDNRSFYVSNLPLLWIARDHNAATGDCAGFFSNVRIVKGTAVYTANFTPPSEPLTAISGTVLLTCHQPYIADGSTNYHSITVNGNVSTKPFSPYDYNEYAAADHGGSVYFVGGADWSSQYLSLSGPTMPSGDFTLSTWAYLTSASDGTLFDFNGNSNGFRIMYVSNSNGGYHFRFYVGPGGSVYLYDQSVDHYPNQWYYIVVVRDSGTFKLYVNNKLINTSSVNPTFSSSNNIRIGQMLSGYNTLEGYLSDIIYNPTTAITDFTPPTAPQSSTGTSLHIKGTDASIIDKSQGANLKLVGNTTGSTTQAKFASSKSIYFDGTSDYITNLPDDIFAFGYDPYTIEFWIYAASYPAYSASYHIMGSSTSAGDKVVVKLNSQIAIGDCNGDTYTYGTSVYANMPSAGNWAHVAFVRTGILNNQCKCYINGTLSNSDIDNKNWGTATDNTIGATASGNYGFNGYIQDLRVTKGLARYTANFTPPTAPLEG